MPAAWDSLTGAESPRWWARKALTGAGESTDARLVNTELDPLLADADTDLQSRYPCVASGLSEGETPWSSLTGTQLSSWAKAVGLQVAMGEIAGSQGNAYTRTETEIKQGSVTRKWAALSGDPVEIAKGLESQIGGALGRIECIKAWRASRNKGKLFSTAGRRQAIGSYPTVQGQMLGLDKNNQLPK